MTAAGPKYLFVYGTLRREAPASTHASELSKLAKYVGSAMLKGKLFLIGSYPGAIDAADVSDVVSGDLYQLRPNRLIEVLDDYEGCGPGDVRPTEYVRRIRPVEGPTGQVRAYVYLYNWSLVGKRRIRSGDYVDYLKKREFA
jgi:gamma-glutamylcyclotransferase (GGCT)/AIG2-like uncharacterized protein YtfP